MKAGRILGYVGLTAVFGLSLNTHATAHFLQTDPVGYEDDVNLYAYVQNDPVNKVDPKGTDAYVQVWDNGRVVINIPIQFSGDAATPGNISKITNDIQNGWSGKFGPYNVTTTVQSVTPGSQPDIAGRQPGDPLVVNNGAITNGPTDDNGGYSYVKNNFDMHMPASDITGRATPAGPGITTESAKGSNTAEHEAGHLMGQPDVQGNHGGIMDSGPGTRVTPNDISNIIKSPVNIVHQCTASNGQCN